jgi:oligopeptide/dipeptide ABC transporter ATP-binding protein
MYAGRIIETASARELYANPKHPYTVGLLRSVPRLDEVRKEKLDPIEGSPPDLVHRPKGCAFYPRCRWHVDKCLEEAPPLMLVGERHFSACWEAERVGRDTLPIMENGHAADGPIKATSDSGERVYHKPGEANYEVVTPEATFATEEEAQAAGYRAAQR